MANLNTLIAQGGTNVASPYQRYQQAQQNQQAKQMNALSMQSTQQQMGIRGQKAEQAKQAQKIKSFAALGQYLNTQDDPSAAFESIRHNLGEYGLPPVPENVTFEQIAPTIEQARLQVHGQPAGKRRNALYRGEIVPAIENEQGQFVSPSTGERMPGATIAPSRQTTGEPGAYAIKPTKKVTGKIQERVLNTEDFLDDMANLSGVLDQTAPIAQTWGGDLTDATLKGLSRTFGIEFEGDVEKFRENKQNVRNFTRKISDSYRKMITGSQANKYELKRIEGQMPNEKDDWNTLRTKIKTLSDIAETSNVRSKMAMSQGFSYVGRRDDGSLIYAKDGKNFKVDDIPTLGDVLSHEDMREKIALRIKGLQPNLPENEVVKQALEEMGMLGYNMRRYR